MTAAWPPEYGNAAQAAALHSLLSEVGPVDSSDWQETQWSDMLALGSDAFTRALVQAEHDLEQSSLSGADSEANGIRCAPASDAQAPLDSTAFSQWAQRIAHLQILDVDDALRLSAAEDSAESKSSESASSIPLADLSVDQQLLKLKLLLAQEEAKTVHLEDRLSRCLFELDAERKECTALRAANAALTSKNLQQTVANTQGCAEGCGLVRLEKERLAQQNEALTTQLQTIEQQTAQLVRQIESQAAHTRSSTPVAAAAAARSSSFSPAAVPAASPVRLPAFTAGSAASASASAASVAAAAVPSLPASPSSAASTSVASASGISLLRVRSSLALARSTLRHQGEISHLMHYKLEALAMQMRMDDLEAALDSEREHAAADAAELARTKAALESKTEEEQALQAVVANLAQQLHRFAGQRGMGMSVSMSSSSPALAARAGTSSATEEATTEVHVNRINVLPTPMPSPSPAAAGVAAPLSSPSASSSSAASASSSASAASAAATAAAVNAGLMTPPRRMPPLHSPYHSSSATATPAAPSSSSYAGASPAQPPLVLTTSTPTHSRSESSTSTTSNSGGGVIGWTAGWFGSSAKKQPTASAQMQSPAQQTMQSQTR